MKQVTIISFFFLIFFTNSFATVHRVNNTGADADFTTAQAAHDGVSAGDTLYFESSPTTYGSITISKEIHIIGTGYGLGQNIDLQANIAPSKIDAFLLSTGCDNSTIQGMTISYIGNSGNATYSDIVIERNIVTTGIYLSSNSSMENVYILRNLLYGINSTYYSLRTGGTGTKNLIVSNNIFEYSGIYSRVTLDANSTAIFKNNIMYCYVITTTFSTYKNNIINLATGTMDENNNTVSYNTCVDSDCSSNNNNSNNAVWNNLFLGVPNQASYSFDSKYGLTGSSDAAGAGEAGIDCGVFDGEAVYKLSGIPAIPTIYKLVAPSIVSGNFNITISTRSNN